jgi:hypothetical protein
MAQDTLLGLGVQSSGRDLLGCAGILAAIPRLGDGTSNPPVSFLLPSLPFSLTNPSPEAETPLSHGRESSLLLV